MSRRHRLAILTRNAERRTRKLIARDEAHPGWFRYDTTTPGGEPSTYIINMKVIQALRRQLGLPPMKINGVPHE